MDAGHTHTTSSHDSRGIVGLNIFLVVIAVATQMRQGCPRF